MSNWSGHASLWFKRKRRYVFLIYKDNQEFEKWRNGLIPKEMNVLGFQCKECQEKNG